MLVSCPGMDTAPQLLEWAAVDSCVTLSRKVLLAHRSCLVWRCMGRYLKTPLPTKHILVAGW